MCEYCVYKHTTPSNKSYIGITCNKVETRWKNGAGYIKSPLFYKAITKYGWSNIAHEILFSGLNESEAKTKEIELIAEYKTNTRQFGYNLTLGGDGASGYVHSEITKERMRKNHSNVRGERNPMYGVILSGERNHMYGKQHTPETRKRIGLALVGSKHSEETRIKMSESRRGPNNPSYGKKGVDSTNHRGVIQLDLSGEVIKIWDCISDAARELGLKNQSIGRCCRGGRKSTGGYAWAYSQAKENESRTVK